MTHYSIRYRSADSRQQTGLLVVDERARAYLFCSGRLQAYCKTADAEARLLALLQRRAPWTPVPAARPQTVQGLQRLAGG
jgi:hypothetical protein